MKTIVLKKEHSGYNARLEGQTTTGVQHGKTAIEALGAFLNAYHESLGFEIKEELPRGVMPQNGDSPQDGKTLYQSITSGQPELFRDYWGEEIWIHRPTGVWVLGTGCAGANALMEELASKYMPREEAESSGEDFYSRPLGFLHRV